MIARISARHALVIVMTLAVLALAKPVAQAQRPNANPSPAALLIAKQIVDIKGIKNIFDPVSRGVVEKAKNTFMQTNFMWAKDLDAVAVDMHKEYDPRASELVDATARIYASHFSEAELKQLLEFYQSPVGRKVLAEEPKIMDESMTSAASWADNLSEDVMNKMRAEMKKRGHDM